MSSVLPRAAAFPSLAAGAAACCLLALTLLARAPGAQAQQLPGSGEATPDSIAARLGLPEGHSPRGALRRALAVPGWGQYYNRQYWKVPVVAAGLGGVVFGIAYSWDRYFLYRNAWRYERQPENYPQHEGARTSLQGVVDAYGNAEIIKDRRERFRRWGEFAILGVGVFWILQVADAYVSAHLLGFELGEDRSGRDVSVRVAPTHEGGLAATLRFSL